MQKAFEESLAPIQEITLAMIEPDPELAARNQQRIDERKAELGRKWIGHQVHAAQRRDHPGGDDVRTTIASARAVLEHTRQHANNVHRLKREAA